jgi:hypothetical protein
MTLQMLLFALSVLAQTEGESIIFRFSEENNIEHIIFED